jgi:hypothetical protein
VEAQTATGWVQVLRPPSQAVRGLVTLITGLVAGALAWQAFNPATPLRAVIYLLAFTLTVWVGGWLYDQLDSDP